jgi:hypothetical protein
MHSIPVFDEVHGVPIREDSEVTYGTDIRVFSYFLQMIN